MDKFNWLYLVYALVLISAAQISLVSTQLAVY